MRRCVMILVVIGLALLPGPHGGGNSGRSLQPRRSRSGRSLLSARGQWRL